MPRSMTINSTSGKSTFSAIGAIREMDVVIDIFSKMRHATLYAYSVALDIN